MSETTIIAERKDAILLAFAVVIRTLNDAAKSRPFEVADVLLETAEAIGNLGTAAAERLAQQTLGGRPQ